MAGDHTKILNDSTIHSDTALLSTEVHISSRASLKKCVSTNLIGSTYSGVQDRQHWSRLSQVSIHLVTRHLLHQPLHQESAPSRGSQFASVESKVLYIYGRPPPMIYLQLLSVGLPIQKHCF